MLTRSFRASPHSVSRLVSLSLVVALAACTAPAASLIPGTQGGPSDLGSLSPGSGLLDSRANPLIDSRANPLTGVAQDAAGQTLAGASVRAFPANALALGSEAKLLSNAAASYRTRNARRVQGDEFTVKADASGKFQLALPPGTYNLEIVAVDGRKAWRPEVIQAAVAQDVGAVILKPTGSIVGKLRSSDPGVTNLLGAEVFVPGSSYLAKVLEDGTFSLTGVPEGEFRLVGWKAGRGEAYLSEAVKVTSGAETRVDGLELRPNVPVIGPVQTAEGESTDNAAPGSIIQIEGERFGRSTGEPIKVRVQGQPVPSLEVHEDHRLRFSVPDDAQNGTIEVEVGNYAAYKRGFRILRSVAWKGSVTRVDVRQGQTVPDLLAALEVLDSSGVEVKQDTSSGRHAPYVRFRVGDRPPFPAGAFPDLPLGSHVLRTVAGNLPEATVSLLVLAPGSVAPPAPSPAPSQDPLPSPSPIVASPSPAPLYVPGILTRGNDAPVWEKVGNAFIVCDVDSTGRALVQRNGGSNLQFLGTDGLPLAQWAAAGILSSVNLEDSGNRALLGTAQGQVRLVDARTGLASWIQASDTMVRIVGANFRAAADEAVTLDAFGGLVRRFLNNGAVKAEFNVSAPRAIRLSSDGTRAFVLTAFGVSVVQLTDGQVIETMSSLGARALEVLPASGEFLLAIGDEVRRMVAGQDEAIQTWDLGGTVTALAVSSDGNRVLAAVEDSESARSGETTVACFNLGTGDFVDSWRHPGKIIKIRFTQDGKRFVVMGDRGIIQTWKF